MTEPDGITITPDQIDDRFIPVPGPTVEQAVVDGDLVLVDGWRSASVVGPLGSVIWGSFDGRATVGQIVDELAAATGADPGVVAHDVVGFTRQMG
ncbi:MAG: PqqD family protein, partial [Acidimicrobiales bacterium]|nr:PqqD family protein [Acidimicrobiales bacterium]